MRSLASVRPFAETVNGVPLTLGHEARAGVSANVDISEQERGRRGMAEVLEACRGS